MLRDSHVRLSGGLDMTSRKYLLIATGVVLVAVGAALALLPKDWIEQTVAVDPDARSGMLEFMISLALLGVGSVFLALGARLRPRPRPTGRVADQAA
jgi:hypothetical protein